ncbi:hypothetical protein Krac_10028 [Ktedonobacter racemifer DSM 44963]|uniref:Uncharacterized protein n=1 Tax=Ktedonobacter racemifer DSM 44963 TaxID=485913 RepID=D6TEV4_KTERA|nr:hypothetical protein Krac_10028 [Ktedonobacter racemifer DSM 44963]
MQEHNQPHHPTSLKGRPHSSPGESAGEECGRIL